MLDSWRRPSWRGHALVWWLLQPSTGGSGEGSRTVSRGAIESRITEELRLLRSARAEHERCPSSENADTVEMHERELNRLMDIRSSRSTASIPREGTAPRSVVSTTPGTVPS